MARGRFLSKSLSTSRRFASLTGPLAEFCQGLYPLLVAHADDYGREPGDPFTIKLVVCPTSFRSEDEVSQALALLHNARLIDWYQPEPGDEGAKFIQIMDFDKHQVGLHKRTHEKIPGPSGNFQEILGKGNGSELNGIAIGSEWNGRESRALSEPFQELPGSSPQPVQARLTPPRRGGLLRGPNPNHAFDGARVYVPQALHAKLLRLRNGAEADLLAWYERVSEAWAHGAHAQDEPGADMFAFWQARYAEEWPAAAATRAATAKARPAWAVKK